MHSKNAHSLTHNCHTSLFYFLKCLLRQNKNNLDVYDQNKNDFIHTQTRIIYTINTKKLTLVGSLGPCPANKVALKETYRMKGLITHINFMNCNLYHYLRKTEVQSPVFKNQPYNITIPLSSRTNLT